MKRTAIAEMKRTIGHPVRTMAWVQSLRNQKQMQFIILRDRTGQIQLTHERSRDLQLADTIESLTAESVVQIEGIVVPNHAVRLGGVEIIPRHIKVLSDATTPLPMDKLTGLDQRLHYRWIDLRDVRNRLIFEVQTTIERAMREVFEREDFLEIHSPKLMGTASESGSELFQVEYFGDTAYLAQSPQFYKQMAMAAGFEKVFEIGPVFRANPSFTSRHDTEFTSVDVEISYIDSHQDVMSFEERWLRSILQRVKDLHGEEIERTFEVKIVVPNLPFPKLTMAEANALLRPFNSTAHDLEHGDLEPGHERRIYRHIQKELDHEFVFVTNYPASARPFYHMCFEGAPDTTKSFDLLWKGLEITTGAQREHRLGTLRRQAREKNLSQEPLESYFDFFRYGIPPHGGFGFGLTRMLMVLLGKSNVREVTYLHRSPNRLVP